MNSHGIWHAGTRPLPERPPDKGALAGPPAKAAIEDVGQHNRRPCWQRRYTCRPAQRDRCQPQGSARMRRSEAFSVNNL